MRRPGRIDQILRLDQPDRVVLEHVVQELARRERVEVPRERMHMLVALAEETSTAHVVELLRRARIEGWDAPRLDCDITFERGFVEDARGDERKRLERYFERKQIKTSQELIADERRAIMNANLSPTMRAELLAGLPVE